EETIRGYAIKNAIAHEGRAMPGPVISSLFTEGLKKEDMKKYGKIISKIINEVNSLNGEQQKKEFEKLKDFLSERETREGLPELPNAKKGKVIMRFRPSPSGPLHIGHIVSNMLSSLYVKEYGGKFYVIIDDTDPETALKGAYTEIKKDCDWIFGNVNEYINSSDRMKIYYKYIETLINKKSAYVCTCSAEKFKKFAEFQENCPCRNNELKENLYRWKKMQDKNGTKKSKIFGATESNSVPTHRNQQDSVGYKEGEAVVRFKTPEDGMKHKNPAMRDFPLARINLTPHPMQGKKYRVWPLMNLVVSVDDIEYKMTHIIRGKDHRDNAERQKMIYTALGKGKNFPWTFFIGRIKFTDLVLSKRKITAGIKSGEFSGAEDEKLPTIASLRKRNYKPEAFENFAVQRGLTEVDKVISSKDFFEILDSFNKYSEKHE
ncbi:MAG: glutamate--tRNA ligase family protein, partial [archaeon]|nr:glutamate--tRNA ligase family protein [archaeon]